MPVSLHLLSGSHIDDNRIVLWQGIATFLLRDGSRNAFDADRNSGCLPDNMLRVCGEAWDRERLGERRTVTCSGNTVVHLARVPAPAMARLPLLLARRCSFRPAPMRSQPPRR